MGKRVFVITFSVTLILFFMTFGICESYIAMQNTMSKDKITSVSEAFINTETQTAEIHLFGKKLFSVRLYDTDIPPSVVAFVPPEIRLLWGITENGAEMLRFVII